MEGHGHNGCGDVYEENARRISTVSLYRDYQRFTNQKSLYHPIPSSSKFLARNHPNIRKSTIHFQLGGLHPKDKTNTARNTRHYNQLGRYQSVHQRSHRTKSTTSPRKTNYRYNIKREEYARYKRHNGTLSNLRQYKVCTFRLRTNSISMSSVHTDTNPNHD